MPQYLNGRYPHQTWLWGNLDYIANKYHRHYQAHDDWYLDRKNKTLYDKNGSVRELDNEPTYGVTLKPNYIPRGCQREIKKYRDCQSSKGEAECFNDKISIMEVCPDFVLEALREQKKWYLRAQVIDNATYRRAMTVSSYNAGRSVADLTPKTWRHGTKQYLRPDSYWNDDRYNPLVYRHAYRYDSVNFPEMEYKDLFGGNWGEGAKKEKEKHTLNFWTGRSKAMKEY